MDEMKAKCKPVTAGGARAAAAAEAARPAAARDVYAVLLVRAALRRMRSASAGGASLDDGWLTGDTLCSLLPSLLVSLSHSPSSSGEVLAVLRELMRVTGGADASARPLLGTLTERQLLALQTPVSRDAGPPAPLLIELGRGSGKPSKLIPKVKPPVKDERPWTSVDVGKPCWLRMGRSSGPICEYGRECARSLNLP